MKFYFNGKLIRTSANHEYTHAVINMDNEELIGCRSSEKSAHQLLDSEISQFRTGIKNCNIAIKALNAGKRYYVVKIGRRSCPIYFQKTDTVQGFEDWIATCERNIEYIKNNYKVVELERR